MNIEITRPEVEAIINRRLQAGGFKDAEDVISQALQSSLAKATSPRSDAHVAANLVELFAPLRGLNLDFEADRSKDTGRDLNL